MFKNMERNDTKRTTSIIKMFLVFQIMQIDVKRKAKRDGEIVTI